jgi:hypothetical protein
LTQPASTADLPAVAWLRDLLWPESTTELGPGRRYAVVVRRGRPRYVVPIEPRRVVASVVGRTSADTTALRRAAQRTIALAARVGVVQPLLRTRFSSGSPEGAASLEDYLAAALGVDRVHIVVSVGPPRPNAKPVLQLLTGDGVSIGFAKVGWNGLTRRLVAHEAATLRRLADLPTQRIVAPRLLHLGTWRGLDISVATPLEPRSVSLVRGRDPSTAELLELAGLDGRSPGRLVGSTYAARLRARVDALDTTFDPTRRSSYASALGHIEDRAGEAILSFGTAHGDWAPWNMIALEDRLLVWDWERSQTDMPALLDVCHYVFQREWLRRSRPPSEGLATAIEHARSHAPAFDIDEACVEVIAGLYLLELALRYAENAAAGTEELRRERHAAVEAELQRFVASW